MSNLLIDERPLMVLPKLATAVGLNEALVLQQIHYWTKTFEAADDRKHFRQGKWWVWNSVSGWESNFPFWSRSTVRRTLRSLREPYAPSDAERKRGMVDRAALVVTGTFNAMAGDKTLWYRVNYRELARIEKDVQKIEDVPDITEDEAQPPLFDPEASGQTTGTRKLDIREGETAGDALRRRVMDGRGETDWGALDSDKIRTPKWREGNPIIDGRLKDPSLDESGIRELGEYLEDTLHMRLPLTGPQVKSWLTGLIELHHAAEGDKEVVGQAFREMERDNLNIGSPHSLVKAASSIVSKRGARQAKYKVVERQDGRSALDIALGL